MPLFHDLMRDPSVYGAIPILPSGLLEDTSSGGGGRRGPYPVRVGRQREPAPTAATTPVSTSQHEPAPTRETRDASTMTDPQPGPSGQNRPASSHMDSQHSGHHGSRAMEDNGEKKHE
ncbi:hypothetical protein MTO96_044730 [Rhipicephalus appendiculatus]